MKFRSESLFSKYNISPAKNINELRVIFQTDPNKRKDLPIVIKTISNPSALLEEELLFIHENSDVEIFSIHASILSLLNELKEKIGVTKLKQLVNSIISFTNSSSQWSSFNYYKTVGSSKSDTVIRDFISMLCDEVQHLFLNSIGEIATKNSLEFYKQLEKLFNSIEWEKIRINVINDEIIEIAGKLNSLESKNDNIEKKLSLLIDICEYSKNKDIKEILKITTKKLSDNFEVNAETLLDCYPKLITLYDAQEVVNFSNFLNSIANMYLDINGKSKYTAKKTLDILSKLNTALYSYKNLINNNNVVLDKNFDKESISLISELIEYFVNRGTEWLNNYRRLVSKVENNCTQDNMYELVKHVYASKPSSTLKKVFSNVILGISDFEMVFAFIAECHKEVAENPGYAKACDPKEVDLFIAKYYWLCYVSDEFTKTMFDNIRGIGFDVMARANKLASSIGPYADNFTRMRVRKQIVAILNTIPRDWYMDDKRVETVIRDFDGTCTSDVSKSAKYIDLYDELFTGSSSSKHGLNAYNNRYSRSSSYSSPSSSYSSPSSTYRPNNTTSSGGGCYVATAVYGSYDCPEVWILRRYRDYYLDKNIFGRLFIKIYYAISPTLVKWFGKAKWFKKLIKPILEKKIKKLKDLGYSDTAYDDKY